MAIIERPYLHQHPLTLCEIEESESDEPPCPVCEEWDCFDGYSCSECKFHPETCGACDCKPSGSFYFCKLCWPQSPYFHKSCAQLPEQIIERPYLHQRPLTLCEIEIEIEGESESEGDKPPCPVCEEFFCFDGYSCSHCKFHPETCGTCDGKPWGSFYFCKLCWPQSPYFHKSCAQLPQQIQITLRPHCVLHFVEAEYTTSSDMSSLPFPCDFCNQSHTGPKFCCHFCNFQICSPCASILIKYHQGRQHFQHFRHHHPLALLEMELEDMKCQMCSKHIHGQSYCCAPCKFYFHKSCGDLTQVVRHPFHPPHSLTFQQNTDWDLSHCDACRSYIGRGMRYRCRDCDFNLHTECASSKPNIKYEDHQHLLILVENMSFESQCQACRREIQRTFFVRCVECSLDFHVRCGTPASLPPSIVYQHHGHPLILTTETLSKDDSVLLYCNACKEEIKPNHPSYRCCGDCQYYAHVRCVITEIQLDKERVKHFSHNHFLFLLESDRNDDIKCYGCRELIQALPAYGCVGCKFYLHRSCFELPKVIFHRSHSHYLTLENFSNLEEGICEVCSTNLDGLIYHCEICDFNLDLDCASEHPSIKWKASSDECKYHEDREGIGHYSHYHHLTALLDVGDMECKLCYKNIHGPSYGCAPCMFYIHKSCGELPQEVRHHPFHPRHSLTLKNTSWKRFCCDACCLYVNPGIRYRCEDCDFDLHLECVSLKPNIKYGDHQHLLILVENLSYHGQCQACRCKIEGTFFVRCVQCRLDFHVHCGPDLLPPTIENPHHVHPLALTTETLVKGDSILHFCGVCKAETNPKHPYYGCVECEYYAHVRCVITQKQLHESERVNHFSHNCFLFLLERNRNDDIKCNACEKLIQAHLAYGCDQCRFYLHKSCFELPREIQHIFHKHALTLESHSGPDTKYNRCCSCSKNFRGFIYQCDTCYFVIDVDCASLQLEVNFEGDEDILTLFNKLHHPPDCQGKIYVNDGALKKNCVKCHFIVYLFRSPLPENIECRSHEHSLTLVDYHKDDNYGMQICDVCEEERDHQLCVYYCAKCDFIAEFVCVIYEVILALLKKPRYVPLRSIGRRTSVKVGNKSLTLKDIECFTDEEVEILQAFEEEMEEICKKFSETGDEAKASTSEKVVYSDHEDFLQHLTVLSDEDTVKLLEDGENESELIEVEDYKTIPRLVGVLKSLLHKYPDIGDSYTLSQNLSNIKALCMVGICATVYSMCNTMIQDVNDPLFYTWWMRLYLARRMGFKVDFMFDRLKRIAQARGEIDAGLPEFNSIQNRYEVMCKLSKEIDGRTKEIDGRKGKIELLRKHTQDEISDMYPTLRLDAEQLNKALELRMMKAGEGLL